MVTITQGANTYANNTYSAQGWGVETVWPIYGNLVGDSLYDPEGRELGHVNGANREWWDADIWVAGRMIAQFDSARTQFVHANSQGTDTQVTDYSGNVTLDMLYEPWGQILNHTGYMSDAHYAGMQQGAGNLYGTPTRQYSNPLGRWLSPDPAGMSAVDLSNPQSWNAYSYALNNPATLTDPEGTNVHVCVDANNGSNTQNCFNLSDEQYASLLQQQNGKQGINLPTGNFPTGSITCGGQVCGTASYYEQGLEDQTVNLLAFAGLAEGAARGTIALGEEGFSALGRMVGIGAEETGGVVETEASATGEAVVASGAKGTVRDAIENGPFNSAVKSNLKRQLQAIGNNATVTIEKLPDGSARISWARPGFEESQKFVKLV